MATYASEKDKSATEKITLAKVKAAKRLMAWSLHSGFIYKIEDFDFSVIEKITDSGVAVTEVPSIASLTANSFFNDRANKILYLRTSDSVNPNGKFISMKFWNFYSSSPVNAAYDLGTGKEVYWLPLIRSTSLFGVQLDNTEQIGFALEGNGTLSLGNSRQYWDGIYETYVFEQQECRIYSWFANLPITEAKLIYKGIINGKSFSSSQVQFKLKDILSQLRSTYPLSDISSLGSAIVPEALLNAKERRIYGKVYGYRPTNIDQVVDGYLLPGTVATVTGSSTVTGSGTTFLAHFSPDDEIIIAGESFTVESVTSNTILDVGDEFEFDLTGEIYYINPSLPKTFTNRIWMVAGHECRQPQTTITQVDSLNRLYIADRTDFDEGDEIFVDASGGEVVTIGQITSDNLIVLDQNLVITPAAGTVITRFPIQNLRINNRKLIYNRDYTIDFSLGITRINLSEEAEKNINPIRGVIGSSISFTATSRIVTGVGSFFTSQLMPNQWIRSVGQFDFYQILSIESDTSLTLRTPAGYTQIDAAQYIADAAFDEGVDILSCEVIGTTVDDTKEGTLLRCASDIVKDILDKVNIEPINVASFDKSKDVQPAYLGFVLPKEFSNTRFPIVRDVINQINQSVFGALVQNEDFEIEYNILQPKKPANFLTLRESDILDINIDSTNDRVVAQTLVNYKNQEYNAESTIPSVSTYTKVSDTGTYLVESMNTKVVDTVLHREKDARLHANRWSFLLELGTNTIKLKTKMMTSRLQVNDVIFIEHEKLFDRIGGGKRKFAAIQSIVKSGTNVEIELDDLANAFNRVAMISPNDSPEFNDSTDKQKATNGFITDQYGLINNDADTFGLNVIW